MLTGLSARPSGRRDGLPGASTLCARGEAPTGFPKPPRHGADPKFVEMAHNQVHQLAIGWTLAYLVEKVSEILRVGAVLAQAWKSGKKKEDRLPARSNPGFRSFLRSLREWVFPKILD